MVVIQAKAADGDTYRHFKPEMHEVVAPALFLASDDASYITGTALLVDGGFAA